MSAYADHGAPRVTFGRLRGRDPPRNQTIIWGVSGVSMRTYGLVVVALLGGGCGSKKTPGDLTVTGSPTGEVTGKIHLTIGFSRPMVAHDQLNKPVAAPPVTVSPQLVGEAKWTDDTPLVVWPRADLPVSTRFVATVPRGTRALDGNELGEAFRSSSQPSG